MIGLTQAMAVDHGRDNIRVNCICPGPMYTPMVYARGNGMSEAARAQRANASVLKTGRHRLGRRPRREISAQRLCPLHHRPGAGGRRRCHAARPGTQFTSRLMSVRTRVALPMVGIAVLRSPCACRMSLTSSGEQPSHSP